MMTNKEALKFARQEREAYRRKVEEGTTFYQTVVDYYDVVVDALEKQEPKKPTHHEQPIRLDIETLDVWEYDVCPICGFTVRMEYDNFCYNCGRPLDWSDEE